MPRAATPKPAASGVVEYVRPREPSSGTHDGVPFVVNPQQVFLNTDPLVRAYPHLFIALEPERQRPAVETTTRIPGEVRG